ncbi:hypothetical protein C5167_007826 [Papaver somniferum]|nr:hypothetical protein C5167_007826 [Papaver somniferum]
MLNVKWGWETCILLSPHICIILFMFVKNFISTEIVDVSQTMSDCHHIHCMLCSYVVHFWLCEWRRVVFQEWCTSWYCCVGRNWSGAPNNPCCVKTIPRPIPEKKWHLTPSVGSLMGGLLPFGSIFVEMYFVFTSFWDYKVYYVFGFMLLVFLILVVVTVCVTIVWTYFLLNAENYHWQWTSFFSAASTAIYMYLYSIYY